MRVILCRGGETTSWFPITELVPGSSSIGTSPPFDIPLKFNLETVFETINHVEFFFYFSHLTSIPF